MKKRDKETAELFERYAKLLNERGPEDDEVKQLGEQVKKILDAEETPEAKEEKAKAQRFFDRLDDTTKRLVAEQAGRILNNFPSRLEQEKQYAAEQGWEFKGGSVMTAAQAESEKVTTVVIASTKAPTKQTQKVFLEELHAAAHRDGCTLIALKGQEADHCYNYGIKIKGKNWKLFVESVTMALMPARYSMATDDFDGFVLHDLQSK